MKCRNETVVSHYTRQNSKLTVHLTVLGASMGPVYIIMLCIYTIVFAVVILKYMLLNYSNDAAVVCIIKILKEQNITQKDPVKCNHLISLSSYSKTIRKINTNKLVYTLYLKSLRYQRQQWAPPGCQLFIFFLTLILKHICRRELKCCHAVMACLFISKGI